MDGRRSEQDESGDGGQGQRQREAEAHDDLKSERRGGWMEEQWVDRDGWEWLVDRLFVCVAAGGVGVVTDSAAAAAVRRGGGRFEWMVRSAK